MGLNTGLPDTKLQTLSTISVVFPKSRREREAFDLDPNMYIFGPDTDRY